MLFQLTSTSPCTHYIQLLAPPRWEHLCISSSHVQTVLVFLPPILSTTEATPTLSQISSLMILSILVCPHIHLSILISATSIFQKWKFLIGQHSAPTKLVQPPLCMLFVNDIALIDETHNRVKARLDIFTSFTVERVCKLLFLIPSCLGQSFFMLLMYYLHDVGRN